MAQWREWLHPRDWRGRFITKGVYVRLQGGLLGTVREIRPGRREGEAAAIKVETRDGRAAWTPSDRLTVADPPHGSIFLGDGTVARVGSEVSHTDEPGTDIVKKIDPNGGPVTVGKRGDATTDREVDPSSLTGGDAVDESEIAPTRDTSLPGDDEPTPDEMMREITRQARELRPVTPPASPEIPNLYRPIVSPDQIGRTRMTRQAIATILAQHRLDRASSSTTAVRGWRNTRPGVVIRQESGPDGPRFNVSYDLGYGTGARQGDPRAREQEALRAVDAILRSRGYQTNLRIVGDRIISVGVEGIDPSVAPPASGGRRRPTSAPVPTPAPPAAPTAPTTPATPTPAPAQEEPDLDSDPRILAADGIPLVVGDRITVNGNTGTITSVRPGTGVAIYEDANGGTRRSARISRFEHVTDDASNENAPETPSSDPEPGTAPEAETPAAGDVRSDDPSRHPNAQAVRVTPRMSNLLEIKITDVLEDDPERDDELGGYMRPDGKLYVHDKRAMIATIENELDIVDDNLRGGSSGSGAGDREERSRWRAEERAWRDLLERVRALPEPEQTVPEEPAAPAVGVPPDPTAERETPDGGYIPPGDMGNVEALTDEQLDRAIASARDAVQRARRDRLPRSSPTVVDNTMRVRVFEAEKRRRAQTPQPEPSASEPATAEEPAAEDVDPRIIAADGRPVAAGETITVNGYTGRVTSVRPGTGVLIYEDLDGGQRRSARIGRVNHVDDQPPAQTTSESSAPTADENTPTASPPVSNEQIRHNFSRQLAQDALESGSDDLLISALEAAGSTGVRNDFRYIVGQGPGTPETRLEEIMDRLDPSTGTGRVADSPYTPPPSRADANAPISSDPADYVAWGDRAQEIAASGGPDIRSMVRIHRAMNRMAAESRAIRELEAMYGELGSQGARVKIDSINSNASRSSGGSRATITGRIVDRDGRTIGSITRSVKVHENGDIDEIHNDYLSIERGSQGQGIARDLYRRQENWAIKQGVPKITIHANIDVGGYAWARGGYDYASFSDALLHIRMITAKARAVYGRDHEVSVALGEVKDRMNAAALRGEETTWPTPFELSRLGYTEGATTWPGKELFLGSDWQAVKNLTSPPAPENPIAAPGDSASAQPTATPEPRQRPESNLTMQRMIQLAGDEDGRYQLLGELDTMYGTLGAEGARTAFASVYQHDNALYLAGSIESPEGRSIGNIERVFRYSDDGTPESIYNEYLSIDSNYQGQGIARDLYRAQEEWAREQGFKSISITANIDVGGYAWARAGYDYADFDSAMSHVRTMLDNARVRARVDAAYDEAVTILQSVYDQMKESITEHYREQRDGDPQFSVTPFELSRIGWTEGARTWPGKELMLRTHWRAIKVLTPLAPPENPISAPGDA